MEKLFKIDNNLCIACGACANDCLVGIIEMNPKPVIPADKEAMCMECQHCLAVCPKGALSIFGKDPSKSLPNTNDKPSPEQMTNLIMNRRSIRRYMKEAIDKVLIKKLLSIASYAPTGENGNSVRFTVVEDMKTMDKLRTITYNAIIKAGAEGKVPKNLSFLYDSAKLWESDKVDTIFRGAPHIVIASAPNDCPSPKEDTMIALSYFELLAISNGMGTLWDGMFKLTLEFVAPELRKTIGIPDNYMVGYAMIFGKPAVKYSRAIQSEGIDIQNIQL
ncbi:MAG: nitroreductase family protein [Bacteroidales bacterium]|jgi:nitroreductase/NAD-dependent dihydropyrimidine dehydrogenase PreA subunit|nr:nitroreductase family protein [Bacteroidales bacterium]